MADKSDDKTDKTDKTADKTDSGKSDKPDKSKPTIDVGAIIEALLDDPEFIALVEKLIKDLVNNKFGAASRDTAERLVELKSWVRREIDMHASGVHAEDREERNP